MHVIHRQVCYSLLYQSKPNYVNLNVNRAYTLNHCSTHHPELEINAILFCPCVQTGQNVGIISEADIQIKVVQVFVRFLLRNI